MTWNSLRNNRTLPVINVQGGGDVITLPNGTTTLIPMVRSYLCTDNLFSLTETGAIRIAKPGRYAFTAGAYYSGSDGSRGLDLAYTETLGATTNLTRLYAAMYQNKNGGSMGHSLPMKIINITNPCDIYLRAWANGATGYCYPNNTATFVNIIRVAN